MSHDSTFPDSPEAPERRTDRALEQLQYEERAGLGFRRRERKPIGNPYAEPERFQVDREPTTGELWAGVLAGIGCVLAVAAVFWKPLLLSALAVVFVTLGSLGDGPPARLGRIGLYVVLVCAPLGMLFAIFITHGTLW